MLEDTRQTIVLFLSVLAGMVLCGIMASQLVGPRGGPPAGLFLSSAPAAGALATLLAGVVAATAGILAGKGSSALTGLFAGGCCLLGLALRLGSPVEFIHTATMGAILGESIAWCLATYAMACLVFRYVGLVPGLEQDRSARPAVLTLLAALPVAWLVARTGAAGQSLGAAFCGALVAGLAARLFFPCNRPILLFAFLPLLGVLSYSIGTWQLGGRDPVDALVHGDLPSLLIIRPVDWAAGGMMGLAAGYGWGKSFQHDDEEKEACP